MAWIPVPKPTETSVLSFAGGDPIGLLLALTKTTIVTSMTTGWGDVAKANSSVWSSVAKPTGQSWTNVIKPV